MSLDKSPLSIAREVYARYPAARWPNPTQYNTYEKLMRRIVALRTKRKELKKNKKHRKNNGTLTMEYQRTKFELVLLVSKHTIVYLSSSAEERAPPSFMTINARIRTQDKLYMPRMQKSEGRAYDKKQQLLDILCFASEEVAAHIPSAGVVSDNPLVPYRAEVPCK